VFHPPNRYHEPSPPGIFARVILSSSSRPLLPVQAARSLERNHSFLSCTSASSKTRGSFLCFLEAFCCLRYNSSFKLPTGTTRRYLSRPLFPGQSHARSGPPVFSQECTPDKLIRHVYPRGCTCQRSTLKDCRRTVVTAPRTGGEPRLVGVHSPEPVFVSWKERSVSVLVGCGSKHPSVLLLDCACLGLGLGHWSIDHISLIG
jgi:hypothetical protein